MKLGIIPAAAFVLAGAYASAALASPELVWCNNCSATANMNAALIPGVLGTVYVGDTTNRTVITYNVYGEIDDSKNPPVHVKVAEIISADATIYAGLQKAITLYNTAPIGWHKKQSEQVNPSLYPSVYKIINSGASQNGFVTYINGYTILTADQMSMWGVVFQVMSEIHLYDASQSPSFTDTLTFSDGSHVDITFNTSSDKLALQPDTAQDSHGNNIPYLGTDGKIHNLGGEHDFQPNVGNPGDLNNFNKQLGKLGMLIQTDPNGNENGATGHGFI